VRAWLVPEVPGDVRYVDVPAERRMVGVELLIVFTVTLGLSGVRSLISLLDSLLKPVPLSQQHAVLNVPQAKASFLDLLGSSPTWLSFWPGVVSGSISCGGLGSGSVRWAGPVASLADVAAGVGLAALIGIPGLGLYFLARALDLNLTVLPSTLNDTWWRIPVLVLAAAGTPGPRKRW